jgi:hypothetical protein
MQLTEENVDEMNDRIELTLREIDELQTSRINGSRKNFRNSTDRKIEDFYRIPATVFTLSTVLETGKKI